MALYAETYTLLVWARPVRLAADTWHTIGQWNVSSDSLLMFHWPMVWQVSAAMVVTQCRTTLIMYMFLHTMPFKTNSSVNVLESYHPHLEPSDHWNCLRLCPRQFQWSLGSRLGWYDFMDIYFGIGYKWPTAHCMCIVHTTHGITPVRPVVMEGSLYDLLLLFKKVDNKPRHGFNLNWVVDDRVVIKK